MVAVGVKAPDFTLQGISEGRISDYSLISYQGKWLVLFFYSADFTFICPTEVAGFTAMFAGAIFMSAGVYLSSSAEKEIFGKELREGEDLAEREPYLAAEGLLRALNQEGLKREQSYRIVKLLAQEERVFLRTFQEKVFGLGTAEINRPPQAALVMGLSFIVGAMIPLLPFLTLPGMNALYLSIALAAVTLFSVGALKGHLAARSLFRSGLEFFFIAIGAALLGYLMGLTVQYFFPGIAFAAG